MYESYMVQGICNFYSLCLSNQLSDIFLFFSGSTRILFPHFKHLNYTSLQCEICVYNNFTTTSHFKCCHKNLTSIKPLFICLYALYLFTTDALVSFQLIPENNIRMKVSESLTINFQLTLIKSYSFKNFFQLKCFFFHCGFNKNCLSNETIKIFEHSLKQMVTLQRAMYV